MHLQKGWGAQISNNIQQKSQHESKNIAKLYTIDAFLQDTMMKFICENDEPPNIPDDSVAQLKIHTHV